MKNIHHLFLALLVLCITNHSFAQTGKGKILIGTGSNLSFTSSSSKWKSDSRSGDNGTSNAFGLSPTVGYFLTDALAIGVGLQLGYRSFKNKSGKTHSFSYGLGPFARYYFGSEKLKPYAGCSLGLGGYSDKSTASDTPPKSNYKTFNFVLGAGLAYFLNDKVSVDLGINYNYMTGKNRLNNFYNYRTHDGTLNIGAGFNIFIW